MEQIDVQELLNRGAYFGHKVSRTNPKALDFVYKAQNGVYIIDLFKTKAQIEQAGNYLQTAGKNNETLLIVATKRVIKDFIDKKASEEGIFFLTEKWIGGFFTNFSELSKNIVKINAWLTDSESGALENMIKHERSKLDKKMRKLLKLYRGVLKMEKLPDNILIIDIKKERNSLIESQKMRDQVRLAGQKGMSILGIVDTNADPHSVDYPIVMNDDSLPSLEYVLNFLIDSYTAGKKKIL